MLFTSSMLHYMKGGRVRNGRFYRRESSNPYSLTCQCTNIVKCKFLSSSWFKSGHGVWAIDHDLNDHFNLLCVVLALLYRDRGMSLLIEDFSSPMLISFSLMHESSRNTRKMWSFFYFAKHGGRNHAGFPNSSCISKRQRAVQAPQTLPQVYKNYSYFVVNVLYSCKLSVLKKKTDRQR